MTSLADSPYPSPPDLSETRYNALEFAVMDLEYLSCSQAAHVLNLSPRTLEKFRVNGGGPAFRKFGRRVLYSVADLEQWAQSRSCRSTSDANYRPVVVRDVGAPTHEPRSRQARR